MVLMSGKARNNASRSNQTTHFGIMGGLGPSVGSGQQFMLRRARNTQRIPPGALAGKQYMVEHDILSKNPAGSAQIGRTALLVSRVQGPCTCSVRAGGPPPVARSLAAESSSSVGCGEECYNDHDPYSIVNKTCTGGCKCGYDTPGAPNENCTINFSSGSATGGPWTRKLCGSRTHYCTS